MEEAEKTLDTPKNRRTMHTSGMKPDIHGEAGSRKPRPKWAIHTQLENNMTMITSNAITITYHNNHNELVTMTANKPVPTPSAHPFRDSELVRLMHIESNARCALRVLGASRFIPFPAFYAKAENQPTETQLAIAMEYIADWDTRPVPPAPWVERCNRIYRGDVVAFLNAEILA